MEPGPVFLVLIVAVIVWLLLREVNAWYWKTNQIILLLERILEELRHPDREKTPQAESRQWACPKCQHSNPNNTFKCEQCGYNLI